MSQSRFAWLDALRLAAGVCIVAVHSTSDATGQPYPGFPVDERVIPLLFRSVVYIARTELFLIISLFLLIMSIEKRTQPYHQVVGVQARRLLLPFAFWVVFYAFFRLIKASYFGYAPAIWHELSEPSAWLGYFLLGDVQYHMHFLPTLFGMVLLYPAYKLAIRRPELGIVVVLCLWAKQSVDAWLYAAFMDQPGFEFALRAVKVLTYGGYGLVAASCYGLIARNCSEAAHKELFKLACFIGAVLFLVKLAHTYQIITTGTWAYNYTPGFWADYLMPAVLFLAVLGLQHARFPAFASRLAPLSFGIYLAHPAMMDLVEMGLSDWRLSPTQILALKFPAVLTATFVIVFALSRSEWLAWTIGMPGRRASEGTRNGKTVVDGASKRSLAVATPCP